MLKTRVIPCLLLMNGRLVKTIRFSKAKYVGDPINIVKIFNHKEVDELVFLDISATPAKRGPSFQLINEIASECFMPFAYGGGITTLEEVKILFNMGVEKIVLNTIAINDPSFVTRVAERYGNQSIIVSMDVKKNFFGKYVVYSHCGKEKTLHNAVEYAMDMERRGAGEILLTSMHCDGMMKGYDIQFIKMISDAVNIPVIASGGAGKLMDFSDAVKKGGASAVAAGSLVVYQGTNRAVLTKFPKRDELITLLP
jgi:cyclase